jgi:hypothetical protein
MPAEILFPVISDFIDPATDQKGNAMAIKGSSLRIAFVVVESKKWVLGLQS